MCGIAVIINGTHEEIDLMGDAISHRGYLGSVTCIDNIKVFFTYLPITDLSAPSQPYRSGKLLVWMNGYISNYKELAKKYDIELETNCDTELLSKFMDKIGRTQELNGFFSIVIYDTEHKHLSYFTDRYGCKQLYKYNEGNKTYIASEIKSINAVCDLKISDKWAKDWLYSLGVMNDNTIYKGVERVECLPFIMPEKISISYDDAKSRLDLLLNQSIKRNKSEISDGVFLSGGIDSGILAKRLNPDYCFSMDYQDGDFSEIENIKLNSVGIHYSIICNRKLFDSYKQRSVDILDDLKAGSCYTNLALTEMASKFCTVLYSGAGGDEVFYGYEHRYNKKICDVIRRVDAFEKRFYPCITHEEYDWKFLKSVLVVEDRMSGFHTMETRYPLLDNDFVDFALSLPDEYRKNKRILKDISGLDDKVINAKKRGFSNPYISNYEWASFALGQKSNSVFGLSASGNYQMK